MVYVGDITQETLAQAAADVRALVVDVGLQLKEIFLTANDLGVGYKGKGEIVTKADKLSNEIILEHLRKKYTYWDIFSEESENNQTHGGLVWIVDPLDGTTNFAMRNAFWNVAVSLVSHENGDILIGVVFAPMYNKLYYAVKGMGAFVNGKRLVLEEDKAGGIVKPGKGFHAFCYGAREGSKQLAADYYKLMLSKGYQVRQLGAAQLELSYIAEGVLDTMFIPGANAYDVAAGILIIREAGGEVLNQANVPWLYDGTNKQDVWAGRSRDWIKLVKQEWGQRPNS